MPVDEAQRGTWLSLEGAGGRQRAKKTAKVSSLLAGPGFRARPCHTRGRKVWGFLFKFQVEPLQLLSIDLGRPQLL